MPPLTLTEEQVAAYAEAMEVAPEEVTPETLAAYLEEQREAAATALQEAEEAKRKFSEEEKTELEQRVETAEKAAEDAKKEAEASTRRFYEIERDSVIDQAIEDFKIEPAKREDWIARYDENDTLTRTFIEELPVNDELARMYGDDEQSTGDEADKMYAAMQDAGLAPRGSGGDE